MKSALVIVFYFLRLSSIMSYESLFLWLLPQISNSFTIISSRNHNQHYRCLGRQSDNNMINTYCFAAVNIFSRQHNHYPAILSSNGSYHVTSSLHRLFQTKNNLIDYQSNSEMYGRGDMHLSADLNEDDDVVVYQTGTWMVDGVQVGDDTNPPKFNYARIDTIQLVWTHNCEHGVIRGTSMKMMQQKDEKEKLNENSEDQLLVVAEDDGDGQIEFGPEQLIARLPIEWLISDDDDDDRRLCRLLVQVDDSLWKSNDEDDI